MTDTPRPRDAKLFSRVVVGVVLGPAVLWLFWTGGYPLFAFLALLVIAGQSELFRMPSDGMPLVHRIVAHASGIAVVADAFLFQGGHAAGIVTAALILFFVAETLGSAPEGRLRRVMFAFLATVYPAVFLSYIPKIWEHSFLLFDGGHLVLILVVVSVWMFDIASYFTGTIAGKHLFIPAVSPKKTWEGFFGGVAGSVAVGACASLIPGFQLTHTVAIALVAGLAGQAGDLAESIVKRDMGVKDSSSLLGGHGGVLDRFDSMAFAAPAVYWYLVLVSGGCA